MSKKSFIQLTIVATTLLVMVVIALGLLTTEPAQAAPPAGPLYAICQVNTTADSGAGSLRACLQNAGSGDTITFNTGVFSPTSPATIALVSALPDIITDNVTIDGSNAGVILEGSGTPVGTSGLVINGAGNVVIKGLQILYFPNHGIELHSGASNNTIGGVNANPGGLCGGDCNLISGNGTHGVRIEGSGTMNNTISGNYIGTDVSGTADLGNTEMGVSIENGASYNLIGGDSTDEGNLISGNDLYGITIRFDGTNHNIVSGNLIGTDVSGTAKLGNAEFGIELHRGPQNNLIGGDTLGERNLISGNGQAGVHINSEGTMSNTVSGNYIGTNISGTAAISNGTQGIWLGDNVSYNIIGGNTPSERNLISGNGHMGVLLWAFAGTTTAYNIVSGNYIGTDANGTFAVGNTLPGIAIFGESGGSITDNVIGGNTPGERNLISGNGTDGVYISSDAAMSNTISGNYIGTDANGTADLGNAENGIWIDGGASFNLIGGNTPDERNLVSGNNNSGIEISSNCTNNWVKGNYIGTDVSGTADLGNAHDGIKIDNGASYNLIGGSTTSEGNLISGNDWAGIFIYGSDTNYNVVSGNFIGTDASGTAIIGQGGGVPTGDYDGVSIRGGASYNLIGGDTPGERNLISGNGTHGVRIEGSGAMSNTVSGNYIGTNVSGTSALSNTREGVHIAAGATHNVIGGDTPGERNIISGNGSLGVQIFAAFGQPADYNRVIGNYIGADVNGNGVLGNGEAGVNVGNGIDWGGGGANYNYIGGNLISGNYGHGVSIGNSDTLYNTITQNSIHSNAAKGIELSDGGNQELFPPILTDVSPNTVSGQAPPNSTVEIFSDAEDEGRYYHGSVVANSSGNFTFTQASAFTGTNVTATATDSDGNTSEFSAPYTPVIDVEVIAILQPKSSGKAGEVVTPTVKVGNAGTTIATGINVSVQASGSALSPSYGPHNQTVDLPSLGVATLTFPPLTPANADQTYNFVASVNLAGDQNPGNDSKTKTVTVSGSVIDLWTRDNHNKDNGDIPVHNPWWHSPDIWVRHEDDGGTKHQNPIAGKPNWVYMVVRNRGDQASDGADTARVYWHEPSLAIKCSDWAWIGDQIIPSVSSYTGTQLLKFSWTPTRSGQVCLYSEIVSDDDPVVNECDVPWDNNLSQQNMNIVGGQGISEQDISVQAAGDIVFEVANIKNAPKPIDIIVDASDVPDTAEASVRLDLGDDLAGRWASVDGSSKSSPGITWNGGSIITVSNATSSTIAGIPMEASESKTVTLLVNAPSVETTTVTVYEAIDAGAGVATVDAIVGGNTYVFETKADGVYLPIILKNQ